MRLMTIRRVWMGAAAALPALAVWFVLWPYCEGLSFVIRAAGLRGPARRLADLATRATVDQPLELPTRRGVLRARLYRPAGRGHGSGPIRVRRSVLLVSGLHPAGIDEPRLVAIARDLAASGLAVVTPGIPDLSRFAITPDITDAIEDAAFRLSSVPLPDLRSGDPRIGLMGISFSGGLSIVAAGRESLRGRIAYVFAFGGHDDLPRVLRYLCTGIEPPPGGIHFDNGDAAPRLPHDYGVAVLLLGVADRLVPAAQVESLRAAVGRFLWASHLDRVDKKKAVEEFTALRDLARRLPPPESTLLNYVNARDVVHLGARLLPYIGAYGNAPALSPSKSAKPSAPVYLLHGLDDNVIPAVESVYLAEDLQGHAHVRLLLSRLISHAEADQPARLPDILSLADFWSDLLRR